MIQPIEPGIIFFLPDPMFIQRKFFAAIGFPARTSFQTSFSAKDSWLAQVLVRLPLSAKDSWSELELAHS